MQPFFNDSNHRPLLANVASEIATAIALKYEIIITEIPYASAMDEEGLRPTHAELTDLVRGYPACRTVDKLISQYCHLASANIVVDCAKKHGFSANQFRVCGVHTGGWFKEQKGPPSITGCVFEIVFGLTRLIPDVPVTVVRNACRDTRPGITVNWDDYSQLSKNVFVE